jgi:hypothetical protein
MTWAGLDPIQFRDVIVRPTLQRIALWSPAAEALVLGTAIHESGLKYLRQVGGGPGRSFYQIEPATHADVWANYLQHWPPLAQAVSILAATRTDDELEINLAYATAICRLLYRRAAPPLPAADDIDGLAAYWKAHYNTLLGKGRAADWAQHYRETLQ